MVNIEDKNGSLPALGVGGVVEKWVVVGVEGLSLHPLSSNNY